LETTRAWDHALEPIWSRYPYQKRIPKENFFGIMVLSKWPLENVQVHQLVEADVPLITARLRKQARTLNLLALHVPSPPLTQEILWRNEIFRKLPALKEKLGSDPFLLMGDINATPYAIQFQQLLQEMNLHDSRQGFGPQGTWKARLGWFGIPLDHALQSGDIRVEQRLVGPYLGSDHRPIELQIAW
ncbi:MAG: endonuclease/exonuclease/phosphatase family protein, partial [Bacteroidota bacterium]